MAGNAPPFGGKKAPAFGAASSSSSESAEPAASSESEESTDSASSPLAAWMNKKSGGKK